MDLIILIIGACGAFAFPAVLISAIRSKEKKELKENTIMACISFGLAFCALVCAVMMWR